MVSPSVSETRPASTPALPDRFPVGTRVRVVLGADATDKVVNRYGGRVGTVLGTYAFRARAGRPSVSVEFDAGHRQVKMRRLFWPEELRALPAEPAS